MTRFGGRKRRAWREEGSFSEAVRRMAGPDTTTSGRHRIVGAFRDVIAANPEAVVASRLFPTLARTPVSGRLVPVARAY
jgi:hypothetical protein